MVDLTKPDWASRPMRLDPYHLPHSVSLKRSKRFSYKIDRQGAVLKRELKCGLGVSMALPQKAFKGVAARTIADKDGKTIYTLELHHHDADMCLPVLVADNLDDIAADWHAWSRLMRLPMLLVDEQNMARPVRNQLGAIMVEAPIMRRKRITMVKHRSWFLRRRKTGRIGVVEKLSAAEIIARH
ncbi:MAG: DUF6101 family protein [Rhizobiaceae bacterium]|nr:DUF6101 family protein [Rhizobiaceae bacterium]